MSKIVFVWAHMATAEESTFLMALFYVKLSSRKLHLPRLGILILLFVLAFLQFSCGGEDAWERRDPSSFVRGYLYAVDGQDHDSVWSFLSADTQSQLNQRAEVLATLAGNRDYTGKDMLRLGHVLSSTREYKKFEELSNDGQKAEVDIVLHDGASLRIELQREQDLWKISLPLSECAIEKEQR